MRNRTGIQHPNPAQSSGTDDERYERLLPQALRPRQFRAPLAAFVLGLALVPFTESVMRATLVVLHALPIEEFVRASKQMAQASTVMTIALVIWFLDPRKRAAVVVFLLAVTLTSTSAHLLKHTFRRARPDYSVLMADKGRERIERIREEYPQTEARAEPGDQWLALSPHPPFFNSKFASFPSGHTTAAFAVAAFLALAYPRLNWLWVLWAAGCGLARVYFKQHFLEDVLAGAALGWVGMQLCFAWPGLARLGETAARRIEAMRLWPRQRRRRQGALVVEETAGGN